MEKKRTVLLVALTLFFVAAFIVSRFTNGQFQWSFLGVGVIFLIIVIISSNRDIQRLIGEYPHPKRSQNVVGLTWGLSIIMSLPIFYILIKGLIKQDPNYTNFSVFAIVPILTAFIYGISKIQNITKKTKTGLICIIKKLFISTILFIFFIPLYIMTNDLKIDLNVTPSFLDAYAWGRGFIAYGMIFCFYTGLFLLAFAITDFIITIKDLKIRKPRSSKKDRNSANPN
jgi:hypothetical protein